MFFLATASSLGVKDINFKRTKQNGGLLAAVLMALRRSC